MLAPLWRMRLPRTDGLCRALGAAALAGLGALATGCATETGDDVAPTSAEAAQTSIANRTSDPAATPETRMVFENLRAHNRKWYPSRKVLVGQQEADVSSTATSGLVPTTSAFEVLGGRPPSVVSYELSHVDRAATTAFDREAFRAGRPALRSLVRDHRARGNLVSFVWHLRCPKVAGAADRFAPADCPHDYDLAELLSKKPNGQKGAHFDAWRGMLDELAELLWSLKDDDGRLVPVQLRPFHEMTGDWFWWGRRNDPEVYKAAWREMVDYLRRGRGLHNVLWVFSPDKPSDRWQIWQGGDFERYYPGDDVVDVVAFDRYDHADGSFAEGFAADLRRIGPFALGHGKVAAVGEVGLNLKKHGTDANPTWFTRSMMAPLTATPEGRSFSYVTLWRNAPWEKFVPEPGDGAIASDFDLMLDQGAPPQDLYSPVGGSS